MLRKEGQIHIFHQVNLRNQVLSTTLSHDIAISEDGIRRDLQGLSGIGRIIKVHRVILSHSTDQALNNPKKIKTQSAKTIIKQKAAHLIKEAMFVLAGCAATIIEFASVLPHFFKSHIYF